jgi:hypothetical protein
MQTVHNLESSDTGQGVGHFSRSKWEWKFGIQRSLNPESRHGRCKITFCECSVEAKHYGTRGHPVPMGAEIRTCAHPHLQEANPFAMWF